MTRQKREAEARSQIIRVHYFAGSYIADGGGKRATCGTSHLDAATELGRKLFGKTFFTLTETAERNTFRATVIQETA